ncbi:hypothetical protein ACT7V1_001064 [Salmonella enterica subsp. enterica]
MMALITNLYCKAAAFRSFAFFTLVTGPAIVFFIAFICMNYSGSPSAHLLSAARAVIDGAPVGKLLICADEPQSTTHPTPLNKPCVREAVDESIVTATWDSSFRMVYAMLAMLSSVIWWLLNGTRVSIFKDTKHPD